MKKIVKNLKKQKLLLAITIVLLCSLFVVGYNLHAESQDTSVEPESGTVQGAADTVSDTSASDGNTVKFGSSTGQTFHTCYPNAFCDQDGQPHVLNGLNIRNTELYSTMTTPTQMQKIKAKGFDVVRLAMYWSNMQPSSGTGGFDSTAFSKVQTAVDNAQAAGLYVILDPIHGTGKGETCTGDYVPDWAYVYDNDNNCLGKIGAIKANAKDYLQRMAQIYNDNPAVIAIDLANEITPLDYSDNDALLDMYNTLIGWVRQVSPDKILIIEATGGDKLFTASEIANDITDKSNILYSIHFYYGGSYDASGNLISGCTTTGYTSSGTSCGNFTYENQAGYVYPDEANLDAHITAELNMLADSSVRLPLYVGEYNIPVGLVNSVQWRIDATTMFKAHDISRTAWEFYVRGTDEYQGEPPDSDMSATSWGADNGVYPGDWKDWVDDIL